MTEKPHHSLPSAPTIEEVTAIVERRHRSRQRLAVGATTAVVAAGLSFAAFRAELGTEDPIELGTATSQPQPRPPVSPTTTDLTGCASPDRAGGIEGVLTAGTERYFRDVPITYEEAVSIADEWAMSANEIKTLAGLALSADMRLDTDVIAQAQQAWEDSGRSFIDIEVVAEEWQLDPVSLKVIAAFDLPETDALLDPCVRG